MNVVNLSALGNGRIQRLIRFQGHSVAGRINSVKLLNDLTGNRTGDLLAQSLNQMRQRGYHSFRQLIFLRTHNRFIL
jgi:hypothetical protein